jgi:hypothetical protein
MWTHWDLVARRLRDEGGGDVIRAKTTETETVRADEHTAAGLGMGNALRAELVMSTPVTRPESPLRMASLEGEEAPTVTDAVVTEVGSGITGDPPGEMFGPPSAGQHATTVLAGLDEAAAAAEAAGNDFTPSVQQGEEAAAAIHGAIASMTSEERAAWFAGEGQALLAHVQQSLVHAGSEDADDAAFRQTVSELMRAGEEGGAEIAGLVAESLTFSGVNHVRLVEAMSAGIQSGDGGLVAAQAAHRHGAGTWFHEQVTRAFRSTASSYLGARDDRETVEAEYAPQLTADAMAADRPELFDPDIRRESRQATIDLIEERRLSEEEAAAIYASTLEGQAWLARQPNAFGITGPMAAGGGIEFLHETQSGRHAAAAALVRAGNGEDTWIADAASPRMTEGVRELVTTGALEGVGLFKAVGWGDEASALVEGAASVLRESDPALATALRIAGPMLATTRDPAEYEAIMANAAGEVGLHMPTAEEITALRERGETLDPTVAFLQRLGVFAAAGEEYAQDNEGGNTVFDAGARGVTIGTGYAALTGTRAPAGLGAVGGAFKFTGGIHDILAGSDSMQDWVNLSLGSSEVATGVLEVLGRNTGDIGDRLGRLGLRSDGVFAVMNLVDATRDGRGDDAAVAAAQVATSGVGLRLTGQAAKRFLGIAGVAWTVYDVAAFIGSVEEQNARSRTLLSDAAAEALGISDDAADALAEFAGRRDGTALERMDVMAEALGLTPEGLARLAVPDDPVLRMFMLGTINNGPPNLDDPRAMDHLGDAVAQFEVLMQTPRRPGEPDYAYRDRLTRLTREASMDFQIDQLADS